MKTVGSILKEARVQQQKSLEEIALQTRIKEKFLEALESSDWTNLPNLPIAQGFAQSFAKAVEVNPNLIVALLRRDFPQRQAHSKIAEMSLRPLSIWTPRTTIFAVVAVTLILMGSYLGRQYLQFAVPPPLSVSRVEAKDNEIIVSGKTSPAATIEINGKKILIDSDGNFTGEIGKEDLISSKVYVQSVSRTGKKTVVEKEVGE